MPATETPPASRSKDRHKARRTVSLAPDLYDQLAILAEQNGRPLSWEVRRVLTEHLRAHGLWPPPEADAPEE